jgi:hypothetical protein
LELEGRTDPDADDVRMTYVNADLDYLYAHHAEVLCPEERCVAARANLAALVEALLSPASRVPRLLVSEAELATALASIPRCELSLPADEHHVHQSDTPAIFAALVAAQEKGEAGS